MQPNDTNLESLTSKTECSEPERKKNEEDEEDTRASAQPAPAPSSDDPDDIQEVCAFCAANLHPQTPLVPIEREMLRTWCQTYTPEWVRAAVHDAVLYGHPTLQYMSKVLESWKQYGFRMRPEKKAYPQQPATGTSSSRHARKNPSAQQMVDNVKAMNIVVKLTAAKITEKRTWKKVVKLSDDLGKYTGDPEEIEICKKTLEIE